MFKYEHLTPADKINDSVQGKHWPNYRYRHVSMGYEK